MRHRGFTLIELLITVAMVAVLASVALPIAEVNVQRSKEQDLRRALQSIREAIDAYKRASDEGHISKSADQSGYPPSLEVLVEGVPDARSVEGKKLYFLRKLPRDPFAEDWQSPSKTWGKRSYESPSDLPKEGDDVFDVYSLNAGTGLNGIPYQEW